MNKQHIIALVIAFLIFVLIVDLVRRRKLSEKFSFLWIVASLILCILAVVPWLLTFLTKVTGAVTDSILLFGLGLIFLSLIALVFSIQLTRAFIVIKILSQKVAMLEEIKEKSKKETNPKETAISMKKKI